MKIFNTLTRQIEEYHSQHSNIAKIYTCGPTVYDYSHIGHWFTYVRADILIRTLMANNYEVNWIMNVTDVGHLVSDADEGEDKLEKGAKREGKTAWQIAEYYTEHFFQDLVKLNITRPNKIVKATEHIADQINLIKILESKGYTYIIDDGVYFDTSLFPNYANFALLDIDEQQAGARVSYNLQKRNSSDFALWKFSPKSSVRDMEWDSPWGKGFPGWHIECSAMSLKYLGPTLDIHTGGIDHVPIHHTNEIAQSESVTGRKFANYWMHSNHVTVNGEKISKSLGNGIKLDEILERKISPMAVRIHILESHYRSQSKFTWESLEAASNRLKTYYSMAVLRWQPRSVSHDTTTFALEDVAQHLINILSEDLNTPQALAFLSQVATQLLAVHIEEDMVDHFEKMLKGIDCLLGLDLFDQVDISVEQKMIIAEREKARKAENWDHADVLRDALLKQRIGLHDYIHGAIWYRL